MRKELSSVSATLLEWALFNNTREPDKDFPGGSDGKESACNAADPSSTPGWDNTLEKGMVTHSNILAQRIPWTEEPGGLQSILKELDTTEAILFPLISKFLHWHQVSVSSPGSSKDILGFPIQPTPKP